MPHGALKMLALQWPTGSLTLQELGICSLSVKSGELRDAVCALPVLYTAVKHLQSLGASVVEVSLPEMEEVRVAHVICILSEMRDFLQPDFNKHFHEMVSSSRSSVSSCPGQYRTNVMSVRNLRSSSSFCDKLPVG